MSTSDPLRQLRDLDQSTVEFPNHLAHLLEGNEYSDCVARLQHNDSAWLVDYFDTALDRIHPTHPAFRRCLRELRAICGTQKMVPRSFIFLGPPTVTAKWPITSRGSCDIYDGYIGDTKYSVKRLRMYSNDVHGKAIHAFCQEAVVWKRLNHPNIVPLLGTTTSPFQFITAWMSGGELSEYVDTHPRADRLGLLSDVADGLSYLHSNGVIHGDLKGPSILVDDAGRARLTDFGLSTVFMDSGSGGSIKSGHAARWAAPEILDKKMPVSIRSDVFSFSMVVIEAFTGKPPLYDLALASAAVSVLFGKRPTRPSHPDLTNELWEMTKRCWHQDPQRRPDTSEVIVCLRKTIDHRCDLADAFDDKASDDTTLESVRQDGSLVRLLSPTSDWGPVSCAFRRLCTFGRFLPVPRFTPDAGDAHRAGFESEKPIVRRRQSFSFSSLSRGPRFWLSGHKPFGRSQTDYEQNRTVDMIHDDVPITPGCFYAKRSAPFKLFRTRSS